MPKLTPAMAALLHTGESAVSSALLTLVIGLVQQISTHQTDWTTLLTVFGSGFIASLGLIYKSVLSSPDLPQAESDAANEAKLLAQQALAHIENLFPLLHTHNTALQSTVQPVPSSISSVMPAQNATAAPSMATTQSFALPTRSFGDSAIMPAALPPKG